MVTENPGDGGGNAQDPGNAQGHGSSAAAGKGRGFASMSSDRQREIARKGGQAAHARGTAHEFTADEARAAGRKGGERVSKNRSHMAEIGRLGGRRSAGRRASTAAGGPPPEPPAE